MKSKLTAILSSIGLSLSACWFTEDTFNNNYIQRINNSSVHYILAQSIDNAVYTNNISADLPLTVYIKVGPRSTSSPSTSQITTAALQYTVIKSDGTVRVAMTTVKTITNPVWDLDFSKPLALFGRTGIIDISDSNISEGDHIIVRLYLSDGINTTGSLVAPMTISDVPNTQNKNNITCGSTGWQAPHVFRVVYSGKRRPRMR